MSKRRIFWPGGNPKSDAWLVPSPAGRLVLRRNHPPVRSGQRQCQGWDVWLDDRHLGAVGGRSLAEISVLPRSSLLRLALTACCGRYKEFTADDRAVAISNRGGRRARAGRPLMGEIRRVKFSTTLDQRTIDLIDRFRGDASRGEYLDQLVQQR